MQLPRLSKFLLLICDALHDLVLFVQFKKREKHPAGLFKYVKSATLLKLTLLHGCFSRFLNCTNSIKSRKAPHIIKIEDLENFSFKK